MSIMLILLAAGVFLFLGGRFYAPLVGRVLGERPDRPTPAVRINDGRDYVPTKTPIVFAHHYASIAGAGPIVGPVIALLFGWGPALLWIVLGGVFLGAVHDYAATHIAMREGGKNLAVVTRRYIGKTAFIMMLVMLVALLVLVCAAFLDLSATALSSRIPLATLKLDPAQTAFQTEQAVGFTLPGSLVETADEETFLANLREAFGRHRRELSAAATLTTDAPGDGWTVRDEGRAYRLRMEGDRLEVYEPHARIGGIAEMSVVIITLFSPFLGYLYIKRNVPVWFCSLLAVGICLLSAVIGLHWPIRVTPLTWKWLVSGYVLLAAGLPVWMFLQSRDFINVHILYLGIVFLLVALLAAAVRGGGEMAHPESAIKFCNWSQAAARFGHPAWPIMFITITCGAVSGFHSLCAGGTTCKQLNNELAARRVGYYGMLLESFLAVCVVACLMVGLSMANYVAFQHPEVGKSNAVLTFAVGVGLTAHQGLGLPVSWGMLFGMFMLEGFLVTTLDTAIRLTRYMIEEGWATIFGRYDVFAQSAPPPAEELEMGELAGTGGLAPERPGTATAATPATAIATRGPLRWFLQFLRQYWVNSGIAVGLMLLLGLGHGYRAVWNMFGSSNQLLAALALVLATCWLAAHRRPVWYTLLPALFMLVTSLTMMLRLLFLDYLPNWTTKAPLAVTDIVVLAMTAGILVSAARRWLVAPKAAAVPSR